MSQRGRKRNPGRLQQDLVISTVLSQAENLFKDAPGKVFLGGVELPRFGSMLEAAQYLADIWAAGGYHTSPESIRARYYALKRAHPDPKAIPEYVKKRV